MSLNVGITKTAYIRSWHLVNVPLSGQPLGRMASRISLILQGKHKPTWNPSTDCGDYIVAIGCHGLHTTGRKREQKLYYTHTTRPGSLKSMSMDKLITKWGGGEVLKRAVKGMLPKNRLRDIRLARLKVFEGMAHPYKKNVVRFNDQRALGDPALGQTVAPNKTNAPTTSA
ncbi:MAG: 54S ribosomal protein L23, mitochondrial [Vezdaea aestivalis]|nr:MAG: 54S ribosomal protein L23, mitochondrial [Vezdaea aestivalis]